MSSTPPPPTTLTSSTLPHQPWFWITTIALAVTVIACTVWFIQATQRHFNSRTHQRHHHYQKDIYKKPQQKTPYQSRKNSKFGGYSHHPFGRLGRENLRSQEWKMNKRLAQQNIKSPKGENIGLEQGVLNPPVAIHQKSASTLNLIN